jgi:hypothetical protein
MQGMTHDTRRFASLAALTLAVGTLCALRAAAQSAAGDPKATEQWTPVPPVVAPGAAIGSPPSDAIILFDGRNLDEWVQNHFRLVGETVYIGKPAYRPYERAAIKLQAHGDPSAPISFRNIWVREIADAP